MKQKLPNFIDAKKISKLVAIYFSSSMNFVVV